MTFLRLIAFLLCVTLFASMISQKAVAAEDELPTVFDLLQAHLAENGGRANMESINTVTGSGHLKFPDGLTYPVKVYMKRGQKMRRLTTLPNAQQIVVFDGNAGARWLKPLKYNPEYKIADFFAHMTEEEIASHKAASFIEGPFFRLRDDLRSVTLVGIDSLPSGPAYRLAVDPELDFQFDTLWIDVDRSQEVQVARSYENESGEEIEETTIYSDFKKFGGVWAAQRVETRLDGELAYTATLDSIKINAGIFDSYFEIPEVE